jgi:hypothetical protein
MMTWASAALYAKSMAPLKANAASISGEGKDTMLRMEKPPK